MTFSRAAKMDTNDAAVWYKAKSARLSEEFLRAVDDAVAQVLEFPESGPLVYRAFRALLLDKFPYTLYYVTNPVVCG